MKAYHSDIETLTVNNNNFRQVLFTGAHCQLVLMSLLPGEDIGMEVHDTVDQFFRFEVGEGKAIVDGEEILFKTNDVLIIPAGTNHNIINTSATLKLKLYTIYSPANHPDGTIEPTNPSSLPHPLKQDKCRRHTHVQ